jgi:hypothetical protein
LKKFAKGKFQPQPFAAGERFHPSEARISPCDSKISHFAIGEIFHCEAADGILNLHLRA